MIRYRDRGERGTESLSMAMIMPLFLLVVWIIITACLYYSGRSAAQSAAAACAEQARLFGAGSSDGQTAASSVLDASQSLTNPSVSVSRGAAVTSCTVTGGINAPITLGLPPIQRTVTMPTEQVTHP